MKLVRSLKSFVLFFILKGQITLNHLPGILETSIVLVVLYTILMVMTCVIAKILAIKRLLHTTYKFFTVSITFQYVSFVFTMAEYAQFAITGIPTGGCGLLGICICT